MEIKTVDSQAFALKDLFNTKFSVDFYQREYVWQTKQIEDLIQDLTTEFLKNWRPEHKLKDVSSYDPYFMGEVVISTSSGSKNAIIDGQQRITTLTLLLIYLLRKYGNLPSFPTDIDKLIYSDFYGEQLFNLDIEERKECMLSLLKEGAYTFKDNDSISVRNLVARYDDIEQVWNPEINENNAVSFTYWVKEKIVFSKVWTNSDEFAYVIFETMNDRGLSLTQVEMLRSYLLANIEPNRRNDAMETFDNVVGKLINIKLSSKSKAEFEFFKIFLRGHYAEDLTQGKNSTSDFTRIGKEFHRWLRDNEKLVGLNSSDDFINFIKKISYFAKIYMKIIELTQSKDTLHYLYLIVNSDYNFTLQPALILSSIAYGDSDEIVEEKIKIVSKYLTKVLTWRTWNHWMISQSSLEAPVYQLCKQLRDKSTDEIKEILKQNPLEAPDLGAAPVLNQQIKYRIKVMLSLITEIVASESGEPDYMLNHDEIEVEHIWSDHYEEHTDEFDNVDDFIKARNTLGDLLVLPKSFNASYNDDPYSTKVVQYFSQNILAQSLNSQKYENAPGFIRFKNESHLEFKPYDEYKKNSISERSDLYKAILLWNWSN